MSIRNAGFGLNYDQGFGPGKFVRADNSSALAGQQSAWDALGQHRQNDFQGGQNDANRGLQRYMNDQDNATSRFGTIQNNQTARRGQQLDYDVAMRGLNDKRGQSNRAFGMLGDLMGSYGAAPGFAAGTGPAIDAGPVLTPGMVQQQVNAARSGNDAAAAGQARRTNADLAGRGFGANSPLAMALNGNAFARTMATNAADERDTRLGAAQMNASHVLDAQKAREQQYASRQQEAIERQRAYTGGLASLIGALGSFT